LSTIFQDPGEEPAAGDGARIHPEHIPAAPHPQADFAPPPEPQIEAPPEAPDTRVPAAPIEDPVPFFLRASEPESAPAQSPLEPWRSRVEVEDIGPRGGSLFDDPAEDFIDAAAFEDETFSDDDPFLSDRVVIDDAAPFAFDAPTTVQPLPERPQGGLLTLAALAALGLTFFGGGIFWATYARGGGGLLGPRLVGGLAGIAGVGFFVVAVYLLLDRLGRAAERQAHRRS
ncbi:MAG TPA: hypothetical protein VFE10_07780, partial [Phenylobacterium sp.]|nr:hypothetical protein [Phenylobacterium sp.]